MHSTNEDKYSELQYRIVQKKKNSKIITTKRCTLNEMSIILVIKHGYLF